MPLNTFGSYVFPFGSDLGGGGNPHRHTHKNGDTRACRGSRISRIKQINRQVPDLLYSSVVKKHPFRRFGVVGKG